MPTRKLTLRPHSLADGDSYQQLVGGASRRDSLWPSVDSFDADIRRGSLELPEGQREYLSHMASGSIVSEDIGGHAAQALLALKLSPGLRAGLIRAMWDEVRHSNAFAGLARALDVPTNNPNPRVFRLLEQLQAEATDSLSFLVLHVELEALGLDVFRVIARHAGSATIRRLYASVATDEASHVRLGRAILQSPGLVPRTVDIPRMIEVHHSARELSPAIDRAAAYEFADAFAIDRVDLWRHLDGSGLKRAENLGVVLRACQPT